MSAHSFRDRIAAYFKARPGQWIGAVELEAVGGRQAWRTRVSDCRTDLGMNIENRQQRISDMAGYLIVRSEYRYLPAAPVQDTPHDLNAWGVR